MTSKPTLKLLVCATLLLETACATVAPRTGVAPNSASGAMSRRVRQAFLHAWSGYRHYAWGHDDLNPISRTPHDWYGESLLMTPVDAYDTMLLMGLDAEAADAKRLILERLSFDRDISVQVFEVLLHQGKTRGRRSVSPALPDRSCGQHHRCRDGKVAGHPESRRRVHRFQFRVPPQVMAPRDADFHRMWKASIAAVNHYVADQRFGGLWYGQVDMASGKRVGTEFGALEAFLPAVLALGGDRRRAERLMESVYRMWTTFGVEPETIDYASMTIV